MAPDGGKIASLKRRVRRRSTFGSWVVEKVHGVVERSTFRSLNARDTTHSDHFWKLRCRKSASCCGAKHIHKSKVLKTDGFRPLFEVKIWLCVAGAMGTTWRFRSNCKNDGRCGTLKRICKDAFQVACVVQETSPSEMSGSQMVISWEGFHFGDLKVSYDDFAWQVQHFVWPGVTFWWQAQ